MQDRRNNPQKPGDPFPKLSPFGDGGFYRTPTTIRDRSSAGGGPFCQDSGDTG
jgi:hypothetical protein